MKITVLRSLISDSNNYSPIFKMHLLMDFNRSKSFENHPQFVLENSNFIKSKFSEAELFQSEGGG